MSELTAKEEDAAVVSRLHVEGAAFKSGRISNGDIICKVDGIPIGQSPALLPVRPCLHGREISGISIALAMYPLHQYTYLFLANKQ